jgi:hypothetical protein
MEHIPVPDVGDVLAGLNDASGAHQCILTDFAITHLEQSVVDLQGEYSRMAIHAVRP